MNSLKRSSFAFEGPRRTITLLGVCILAALASCSPHSKDGYLKGNAMGTFYTIHYQAQEKTNAQSLKLEIEKLLNHFENQLSNWREGSWINRFNAAPADKFIPAPDHAYQVIRLCLELAEQSEGMLDPTLGPLIELWGFGTRRNDELPGIAAIQETLQHIGYRKLVIDQEKQAILKTNRKLQLNCSAVAKGYAVDLAAELLEANGIANFLINIGGETFARGTKADGTPWRVGISQPTQDGQQKKSETTFSLSDRALATSGHSQRTFIRNGKRYSHILDPRTGYPVSTEIASATVLAPNCALADGLATLALILDEEQMEKLLSNHNDVEVFRNPWRIHEDEKSQRSTQSSQSNE